MASACVRSLVAYFEILRMGRGFEPPAAAVSQFVKNTQRELLPKLKPFTVHASRCDSGVERWRDCLPPSLSRSGGMERSGTYFLEWIDKRSFYKSALYPMSPDMVGCAGSAQAGIHQSHPPRASQGRRRRRRQVTSVSHVMIRFTKGSSFTSPITVANHVRLIMRNPSAWSWSTSIASLDKMEKFFRHHSLWCGKRTSTEWLSNTASLYCLR